jgi:antitoxin ParD1/3/4
METMNISMPESMKKFVEDQIDEGGYSTASEYVRSLIREDQKRKAEEKLEMLLLEGIEGEATEVTDEWWKDFRARLIERHQKSKRR